MNNRFTLNYALEIEQSIRNDLSINLIDFNFFPTFTFKKNHLRCNADCSSERLNEIRRCLNYCFRSVGGKHNRIRPKDMIYYLKDEVSSNLNWHVHAVVDLSPLIKKGIPVEWFWRKVNSYWSTQYASYLKFDTWKLLESKVKEPRHGWMNVERTKVDNGFDLDNQHSRRTLFNYQTKLVRDYELDGETEQRVVSNLAYLPSYGLLETLRKRSNELGTELQYIKRN